MLPRNPFFIRQTEKIDTVTSFLALLNPEVINFIETDDIHKTIIYRSTAGGGKSTIFRLFSPDILNELVRTNNDNYKECHDFLTNISVIKNDAVNVLGIYIPCARNYSIIDDIYENGRRTQVFFALLNLRIITATLKNILILAGVGIEMLDRISFQSIPQELIGQIDPKWTGQEIYDWAVREENKLCLAIDDLDEKPYLPFAHNVLSSLKLIEASNIMFDHKRLIENTLVMFDDVHKLTATQRNNMFNCIFQLRPNIGIWIAERFSALNRQEVLGEDGKRGREYEEKRLENLDRNKITFNKSLLNIADRRVRINHRDELGDFVACLGNNILSDNNAQKNILRGLEELKDQIFNDGQNTQIEDYFRNLSLGGIYQEAIFLRGVKVMMDRALFKPQASLFDIPEPISVDQVKKEFNKIKSRAEYYFCIEQSIPFYYGKDKICNMSFNNVEQYLSFAGGIFERWIASSYVNKRKRESTISPREQEEIITNIANDKWKEIARQHSNSKNIQKVLSTIVRIGIEARDKALASYGGGAYTGIGIKEDILNEFVDNNGYSEVMQILYTCVTSNYLNVKTVAQGRPGEKWKVFYLNRWICALNKLPLDYGGWKPISEYRINDLLNNPSIFLNSDAEEYGMDEESLFHE